MTTNFRHAGARVRGWARSTHDLVRFEGTCRRMPRVRGRLRDSADALVSLAATSRPRFRPRGAGRLVGVSHVIAAATTRFGWMNGGP